MLSMVLVLALFLASLHHNTCGVDVERSDSGSIVSLLNDLAVPSEQGDCLPGHCHCVCHITADTRVAAVSSSVEFADTQYGVQQAGILHSLTDNPPFKPPRA